MKRSPRRSAPASFPNSNRPLQIVHGLDQWPDTTDAGLRERLGALHAAGLGGIVTNVSFKRYLRDPAAWELLVRGVRLAHAAGLRVWIYDEEGYPSPAAGGRVIEEAPSTEAVGLVRHVDGQGRPRYEVTRLYEATHATENFYQKRACPNLLDPKTTSTFLAVTHDEYARLLRPIARYVEAFFTDEPSLIATYIPKDRDYPLTLPWHPRLPAEFRARKGYALRPHLERLFVNTGPLDRRVRCDFWDLIGELCAEDFFGGLQRWCRRHRVASSGHLLGEETMVWQTMFNGEPFGCYRRFDIPGIDMITSDPEKIMAKDYFMVAKIAGSAARLQGSRRVMCEISDFFGIMDKHHASIEQMQCTAGLLFAGGITDLCSYYTLSFKPAAELKPGEFPPREYRRYTEHVTRLNARFTAATITNRVAVLYPIRSLQAHYTPSHRSMYEPHPDADVRFLDAAFTDLCRSLLQHQVDYDVVDEASLARARVVGRSLVVGTRRYAALVVPPADTVRQATLRTVGRFAAAGGDVVAHARAPRFAAEGSDHDASVQSAWRRIQQAPTFAEAGSEPDACAVRLQARGYAHCEFAPRSKAMVAVRLGARQSTAFFLVNASGRPFAGRCRLPVLGRAMLHNPATGRSGRLASRRTSGNSLTVALQLAAFGSAFIEVR